jgi:hypothetical protein
MTFAYGFGFDFVHPCSRRARIARIDALATLLDSALIIPGTGVRFGLDALVGLLPAVGDIITTMLSLFIVHEAYPARRVCTILGDDPLSWLGTMPCHSTARDQTLDFRTKPFRKRQAAGGFRARWSA